MVADTDQGATTQFATVGYAVTKTWAAAHPRTLAAFYTALEEGQEIADTHRAAVEEAMEDLPSKPVPLGVPAGPGSYLSGAMVAAAVAAAYAVRARRAVSRPSAST